MLINSSSLEVLWDFWLHLPNENCSLFPIRLNPTNIRAYLCESMKSKLWWSEGFEWSCRLHNLNSFRAPCLSTLEMNWKHKLTHFNDRNLKRKSIMFWTVVWRLLVYCCKIQTLQQWRCEHNGRWVLSKRPDPENIWNQASMISKSKSHAIICVMTWICGSLLQKASGCLVSSSSCFFFSSALWQKKQLQ